jgi:hypothetical protein
LEKYEKDLKETTSAIRRVSLLLTELEEQKSFLDEMVKNYKTALHPIKKLSNELLMVIFMFCRDGEEIDEEKAIQEDDPALLRQQDAPWALSHVSQRWRQVALSFPPLWCALTCRFTKDHADGYTTNNERNRLVTHLHRTSSYPLSILIISSWRFKASLPLFQILMGTCPRWKSLRLCLMNDCFHFLAEFVDILSSLEQFSFNVVSETDDELIFPSDMAGYNPLLPDVLRALPNLRRLVCPPTLFASSLRLSDVTHYSTPIVPVPPKDVFNAGTAIRIVYQLPKLKTCTLLLNGAGDANGYYGCESLECLTLIERERGGVKNFLDHLKATSLKSLTISSRTACKDLAETDFLSRCSCPLETLTICTPDSRIRIDSHDLVNIFRTCRGSISTLELGCALFYGLVRDFFAKEEAKEIKTLVVLPSSASLFDTLRECRPGTRVRTVGKEYFNVSSDTAISKNIVSLGIS